jgi:hypothetical protein
VVFGKSAVVGLRCGFGAGGAVDGTGHQVAHR